MIERNKLLICLSSGTIERHRNVTQLLARKTEILIEKFIDRRISIAWVFF